MGFVQFPAFDTEPAKSGSAVAQHLAHVYKEYLMAFDNVYVSTVMDTRRTNDALTARGMIHGAANAPPQGPMHGNIADSSQMQLVMACAYIPLAELEEGQVQ
jgi:phosphohistidine phosphatase SixA